MEEVELLSLPREVLIHIGLFLRVEDLLACSATCSYLRSVLNDNWLWRRHYRRRVVSYIREAPPQVRPEFTYESPECGVESDEPLEVLCEERLNLMRQNHLLGNWESMNHVSHEVLLVPGSGVFLENNDRQITYKSDFLFLHTVNTDEISIWNIREAPHFYTSVRFSLYEYDVGEEDIADIVKVWYEVVRDKLIVIQGNTVQIFGILLPELDLPLEHLISIDREEPVTDFSDTVYADCYNWVVGRRLYSRVSYLPVLHVWDLCSGEKVRTLVAPVPGWDLSVISGDDEDSVVLTVRTDEPSSGGLEDCDRACSCISDYCLSSDTLTPLLPALAGCKPVHALRHPEVFVVFCIDDMFVFTCTLYVVDRFSLNVVAQHTFSDLVGLYKSRVVQDRLVMATQQSVEVLDVRTLAVLQSLPLPVGDIIDMDYLPLLDTTFVITPSAHKEPVLYDVDKRRALLTIPKQTYVFINESCSKLIILSRQTLVVRTFW